MKNQKIIYIARVDKERSLGIYSKLVQSAKAFEQLGHEVETVFVGGVGNFKEVFNATLAFLTTLFMRRPNILIVRSDIFTLALVPALLWQRAIGTFIIIDVPTPIASWVAEQDYQDKNNKLATFLKKTIMRVSYPFCLWPAHKVVQYAKESAYFSLGLSSKTVIYGNGIDVGAITVRTLCEGPESGKLVLIGVASVSEWHGFDRIISGMHQFKNLAEGLPLNVTFIIVGDGPGIPRLKRLCVDLNMGADVRFEGFCSGDELDELFNQSHIAVSSIGLHRVGLEFSSSLKSREYAARGIPFIASGCDVDFQGKPFFMYSIEEDDSAVDLVQLTTWYAGLNMNSKDVAAIRSFAAENLCFSAKVNDFIS